MSGLHKVLKVVFLLGIVGSFLVVAGGVGAYLFFARSLPSIGGVADYKPPVVTEVIAQTSTENPENPSGQKVVAEFYEFRRYLVPVKEISPVVKDAFLAAEDESFYQHQGINIVSISRAVLANLRSGEKVQGGSTITQQVAKSILGDRTKSYSRKLRELLLAASLEKQLSKDEILYLYLNEIFLGQRSYGIEAAARTYFNKPSKDLGIAEAALLAGLPQAPSELNPISNPKKAKERQLYSLRRMFESGKINQQQYNENTGKPIRIYFPREIQIAPHFSEHIRRYLIEKYGKKNLYEGGLKVILPSSYELMTVAQRALQRGLRDVDRRSGYRGPIERAKGEKQATEALEKLKKKFTHEILGFLLLDQKGELNLEETLKEVSAAEKIEAIKDGKIVHALVTYVDDKKKLVNIHTGALEGVIPFEGIEWARYGLKRPSEVIRVNDVIPVSFLKEDAKGVQFQLDQEPKIQGALFSIDARTGAVLAMVGGYDFNNSEFNRVVQSQRQPGSSFKPFIYSAALENGFTSASILLDAPIVFDDSEFGKWKPKNFGEKFYGEVSFREALIQSMNVPTIKIAQSVEIPKIMHFIERIHLKGEIPRDMSIALGTAGISLFEMVKAFSIFPRLGRKIEPIFYTNIQDRDGNTLEVIPMTPVKPAVQSKEFPQEATEEKKEEGESEKIEANRAEGMKKIQLPKYPPAEDSEQVMDPRVAYVMTHLMKDVVNQGTGVQAKSLGRPSAGKTGTTNDYVDAWWIGYTPRVVTGVWVGFDTVQTIGPGETGAKAALPIWIEFMKEATKSDPEDDFTIPSGVVFAMIDPKTGKLSPPQSNAGIKECFIEGTQPTEISAGGKKVESSSEFLKEDF